MDGDVDVPSHVSLLSSFAPEIAMTTVISPDASVPDTLYAALSPENCAAWLPAITREMAAHTENGSFVITDLPPGETTIGSRFVFVDKFDENGDLKCHKARFVAQGFSQVEGLHFSDTYAPTLSRASLRSSLAVAIQKHGSACRC